MGWVVSYRLRSYTHRRGVGWAVSLTERGQSPTHRKGVGWAVSHPQEEGSLGSLTPIGHNRPGGWRSAVPTKEIYTNGTYCHCIAMMSSPGMKPSQATMQVRPTAYHKAQNKIHENFAKHLCRSNIPVCILCP